MTLLRALAATLLATVACTAALVLGTSAPAVACSCVSADTAEFVRWSEVVVRGTLVEVEPPVRDGTGSSTDPATYTFDVAEVFEGSVGRTAEVASAVSGASCGLEGMEVGQEYLVFAGYSDLLGEKTERLHANLCGGTGGAGAARVAEVEEVTGPGHEPATEGPPGTGAATPAAGSAATAQAGSGVAVWGAGAALLVGGVAATLAVGRRRAGRTGGDHPFGRA